MKDCKIYKIGDTVKTDTTDKKEETWDIIMIKEAQKETKDILKKTQNFINSTKKAIEKINDKIELAEADTVTEYGLSYNTVYEDELMADTSNYDGEWQPYSSNNRW